MPKDDTTEKPRKKVRESKNPKQVNTTGVSIEDTIIKKEQKEKSDAGESSNEDGRTLQKLLYQATKDKKDMMEDAPKKVKGKKIVEKRKT